MNCLLKSFYGTTDGAEMLVAGLAEKGEGKQRARHGATDETGVSGAEIIDEEADQRAHSGADDSDHDSLGHWSIVAIRALRAPTGRRHTPLVTAKGWRSGRQSR